MPTPLKSIEQKQLEGQRIRPADKLKEMIPITGEPVLEIEMPEEAKNNPALARAFESTIRPLTAMGYIYPQNLKDLDNMFSLIREINKLDTEIKKAKVSNAKYKDLNKMLLATMKEYSSQSKEYILTPAQRMKTLMFTRGNENPKKDELEDFLDI